MMQSFIRVGYKIVDFEEKADIYVINTCTVTNMADKKEPEKCKCNHEEQQDMSGMY